MAPDPTRTADTKAWLAKAFQDLRRVEIFLDTEPPDIEGALYHCQQAAEKAFKLSSLGTMFLFGACMNSRSSAVSVPISTPH